MQLAALAMYAPLHALPAAQGLLERTWPDDVDEVVTQQLREPLQERALRSTIAQLTAIEDATSQRVRQMYEENPYPRWVHPPADTTPLPIDQYLRGMFPTAAVHLARQNRRPRRARGRLRHWLACHWNCKRITGQPAAGHRSESVQSGLRQTQDPARFAASTMPKPTFSSSPRSIAAST